MQTYKPDFRSYFIYPIIKDVVVGILMLLFLVVSMVFIPPVAPFLFFGLISILLGIFVGPFFRWFQYQKEVYELYDDRIVYKYGSLFSDGTVELRLKNVTLVEHVKPFIKNWLLGTGSVRVESAGSAESEVVFQDIVTSTELYKSLIDKLKQNGFDLSRDNLLMEARPSILGVIINFIVVGIQVLLVLLFFGVGVLGDVVASIGQGGIALIAIFLLLAIIASIIFIFLMYMDLRLRRYRVYDQTITYHEGFLTTHDAFIAVENLADANTKQNFLQKLFGIYDLGISSQGRGKEIKFTNIMQGRQMEQVIDGVIESTETRQMDSKHNTDTVAVAGQASKPGSQPLTAQGNEYTTKFRMNFTRVVVVPFVLSLVTTILIIPLMFIEPALLFLIIIPIFSAVLSLVGNLLKYLAHSYEIAPNSIKSKYSLLTTKNIDFSVSKVTGVIQNRDLFDQILGTMTVKVLSIGSGENIEYKQVTYDPQLSKQIVRKQGVEVDNDSKLITTMAAKFDPIGFVAGELYALASLVVGLAVFTVVITLVMESIIPAAFVIGLVVIAGVVFLGYLHMVYARTKLFVYDSYIEYQWGLLRKGRYFVTHDNVKDITTTKYPGMELGNVRFNVAGDTRAYDNTQQQQYNQQQAQFSYTSNHFEIKYIENITKIDDILDALFLHRPSADEFSNEYGDMLRTEAVISRKPVIWQAALGNLIVGFFFPPLWLFVPIVLWTQAVIEYRVEQDRVVSTWGIIYRRQQSILHHKVDFINKREGFFNKIFSTGNIDVNTVGSGDVEMTISNIPDYEEFHAKLSAAYNRN